MSAPTLAYKSVAVSDDPDTQVIEVREDEGIVTAVVSVTGVVDEVDDIIEPGAYAMTLKARTPKVCWHHSWEKPIGRVLHIVELMPGDKRLPTKQRNGQPWPREAGALVATMQMNLKSELGRESFEAIRFYSETGEAEWSIGYQVPAGKSTRDKAGVRRIKSLELYELSWVLFGAHPMSGTLSVKAAFQAMVATKAAQPATGSITAADLQETLKLFADLEPEEGTTAGAKALLQALQATAVEAPDPASYALQITPLGQIQAKDNKPGDSSQGARELIHWYEHGEGAAKIRWGQDGDFMRCVRIAAQHMTTEQAKGFCSNRHLGATGVRPGQEKAAPGSEDHLDETSAPNVVTKPPNDPDDKDADDFHETGVMVALFPEPDAAEQIAVRGGEKADELHITLAFLGNITDSIGDGMTLDSAAGRIAAACQIAAATYQPLSGRVGGIGKFPDTGDGVPVWAPVDVVGLSELRDAVVAALVDAGLPVKTDHGFTPHMTLGYNLDTNLIPPVEDVPVSFDKIVVAVGTARAYVPIGSDPGAPASGAPVAGAPFNPPLNSVPGQAKATAYDPALEVGPHAGHRTEQSGKATTVPAEGHKMFPRLEGTYEDRLDSIQRALDEALLSDVGEDEEDRNRYAVEINGTWPDRVVATLIYWGGPGAAERQSYEVSYTISDDGTITLGELDKVKLSVVAVDAEGDDMPDAPVGDTMPLAERVEYVVAGLNVALAAAEAHTGPDASIEVKAGRVLSSANAQRLRSAAAHLVQVLAAAGIYINDDDAAAGNSPVVDTETTAPSARDTKAAPCAVEERISVEDVTALLDGIEDLTAID